MLFHHFYTVKGLEGWWFITKQLKALVKLFDGHDSSTSVAQWKAKFWMVSIKEGYYSPSFWTYWCAPIHTRDGPLLLKYNRLSYKAILAI